MKKLREIRWSAIRARAVGWLRIGTRWIRDRAAVLLDVAAFVVITIGVARLFGDWAWLTAGALLILAGLRASE